MSPSAGAQGSSLRARIIGEIRRDGPMRLDRYWNLALFDRTGGYYTTREPFGTSGDFTTAPEISQMFGELIGAWIASAWAALGRPSPFALVEIGPGRGTLMADLLRTLRRAAPACLGAARIRLVETSERLAALQATKLDSFDLPIRRVRRLAEVEPMPTLLIANELFDAIAIRQFVRATEGWRERAVTVDDENRLAFTTIAPAPTERAQLAALPAPEGAILELSPEREALAAEIGLRLASTGGAGLLIDYGHAATDFGDTLQALSEHAPVDPLADPGLADITSHVDFARIGAALAGAGLAVSPVREQGRFLLDLGLVERAGQLGSGKAPDVQADLTAAVHRLAGGGAKEMGRLFKVLAAASMPLPLPPFSPAGGD